MQHLLSQLPNIVQDELDEEDYILHIARHVDDDGNVSWFAYYGNSEDHEMENGELTGAGMTLGEALQDLIESLPKYEEWRKEQNSEE